MKKRTFAATLRLSGIAALACMMLFAISGCSPEQNDRGTPSSYQYETPSDEPEPTSSVSTETPYTLFVDNDERSVWYLVGNTSSWGKDADAQVYVFEQGEVTSYPTYYMNLGDAANHSDDQVVTHCEEVLSKSEYFEPETENVTLHITTDKTGNSVEKEHVAGVGGNDIDYNVKYGFYYITSAVNEPLDIYDAQFAGYRFYTTSGYTGYFVTKTDGTTNFALDNLSAYDIPID